VTWNELRQFIDRMRPEHRDGEVKYVEPYDKEREGFCVSADFASEEQTIGGGDEPETVFVRNGEPFLYV
jgi:hypothetical protein